MLQFPTYPYANAMILPYNSPTKYRPSYKGYRFSLRCTKSEIHGKLFGEICELFLLIDYKVTLHYYN